VLTNMLPSVEQHVAWIRVLPAYMQANGLALAEPPGGRGGVG
jgi:hypothetical protein